MPEVVEQPVGGDDVPLVDQQPGQEGTPSAAAELDLVTVDAHAERAEDTDGEHGRDPVRLCGGSRHLQ